MNIKFDFREGATRQSIISQLCECMSAQVRAQFDAACAQVIVPNKHHHNMAEITQTIDGLNVSEAVRENVRAVYNILASAEAFVHETSVEQAHFHEVGRAAGIENVVEICLAFEVLSPDNVISTPIQVGSGTIQCAHGVMPIPAPATAVILDSGIPVCARRLEGELCTPTSAAIIKHFVNYFYCDDVKITQETFFKGHVKDEYHAHTHSRAATSEHDCQHSTHDAMSERNTPATSEQHEKLHTLKHLLEDAAASAHSVVIAFSGGVDSTFLLSVAHEVLGDKVLAITASSAVYPESEEVFSKNFCEQHNIVHVLINHDVFTIEGFKENTKDRCYFCKKALLAKLRDAAYEAVANASLDAPCDVSSAKSTEDIKIVLMDGTNATDALDVRPGARALQEAGVLSPLCAAGLSKQDIRDLSHERDLPTWNKPSFACLASRVAFGDEITPEILKRVGDSEEMLRKYGFKQLRVRAHDAGMLARIEVLPDDVVRMAEVLQNQYVLEEMHKMGFKYVSIDADGYRTGSMNDTPTSF